MDHIISGIRLGLRGGFRYAVGCTQSLGSKLLFVSELMMSFELWTDWTRLPSFALWCSTIYHTRFPLFKMPCGAAISNSSIEGFEDFPVKPGVTFIYLSWTIFEIIHSRLRLFQVFFPQDFELFRRQLHVRFILDPTSGRGGYYFQVSWWVFCTFESTLSLWIF